MRSQHGIRRAMDDEPPVAAAGATGISLFQPISKDARKNISLRSGGAPDSVESDNLNFGWAAASRLDELKTASGDFTGQYR